MNTTLSLLTRVGSPLPISPAAYPQNPLDFNNHVSSSTGDFLLGARPYIACSLPICRLPASCLQYRRRNGKFFLEIIGRPEYGVPFGQDRLVLFYLATLAIRQQSRTLSIPSFAAILAEWKIAPSGSYYQRLREAFQRVLSSTIYFGTDNDFIHGTVWEDNGLRPFPPADSRGGNSSSARTHEVTLSKVFWRELQDHPIPVNANIVRTRTANPGCLDLYAWLTWRCRQGSSPERVPLFGARGLQNQLGVQEYARERKFRERLSDWLELLRVHWPGCPAALAKNGAFLEINTPAALRVRDSVVRHQQRRRASVERESLFSVKRRGGSR